MESSFTSKKRMEIEEVIYKTFDAVDTTKSNSEYYKNIFKNMSDEEFYKFLSRRLPFRFHVKFLEVEPDMACIMDGFKVIKKPLLEKVKMPFKYVNSKGEPIESEECMVVYINIKRMKQILSKKNSIALNIGKRDMRTGRLLDDDKGGQTSDREFSAMGLLGLQNTMDEFDTIKADAMEMKAVAYNLINTNGELRKSDLQRDHTDSIGKNYLNVYFIGAHLHSNLVDEDYYTPHTIKNRRKKISRED